MSQAYFGTPEVQCHPKNKERLQSTDDTVVRHCKYY